MRFKCVDGNKSKILGPLVERVLLETRQKNSPFVMVSVVHGGPNTADISIKAREFIRQHIGSVWQLELLLLFKRSGNSMDVLEASRALRMESRALEEYIKFLAAAGILVRDDNQHYAYAPQFTALSEAIDEAEKMYSERRVAVVDFIYASPRRNFSDALKFRYGLED